LKLLLDEMYPPAVAESLRTAGHDVVAVKERVDLQGSLDADVLEAGRRERRVLVTEDTRLLWSHQIGDHFGVLFVSTGSFPRSRDRLGPLISALDEYLRAHPSDDELVGRTDWLGRSPEIREEISASAAYSLT